MRTLAKRRASSKGLEHGPDRAKSTALLPLLEDPYLDGFVPNMLAGGVRWGTLRHAMGAIDHPNCQWCQSALDTSEHLLVYCPATAPIRAWAQPLAFYTTLFSLKGGGRGRDPLSRCHRLSENGESLECSFNYSYFSSFYICAGPLGSSNQA